MCDDFSLKDIDTIAWDWNGTLFDDIDISVEAVNMMLKSQNLPLIDKNLYYEYIDIPISKFYVKAFKTSEFDMDKVAHDFYRDYESLAHNAKINDEIINILKFNKEKHIKQVIVSGSNSDIILNRLKKLGMENYFDGISGADNYHVTSKEERCKLFFEKEQIIPSKCLFIGDMIHDSDTAKLAGCHCVLLASGHQSYNDLIKTRRKVFLDSKALFDYFMEEYT